MPALGNRMLSIRAEWPNLEWPEIKIPFSASINPLVMSETDNAIVWAEKMGLISLPHTRHCLTILQPLQLAAHTFPTANREQLHFASDLMAWFFVLDDCGEQMNSKEVDPQWKNIEASIHLVISGKEYDKIQIPPLARALADLIERASVNMSDNWTMRFCQHIGIYFDSYIKEARNRATGHPPEVYDYIQLRRETSAMWAVEDVCEYVSGIEIPAELYITPEFQALVLAFNDITAWENDIEGFVKEVIDDEEVNNLVATIYKNKGGTLQMAMDECARLVHIRIENYITTEKTLLYFIDASTYSAQTKQGIKRCLEVYRSYVKGFSEWSKLTQRYSRLSQPENGVSIWRDKVTN